MCDGTICDVLQTFPTEFPLFMREHLDGMYRCDVYFLCKTMADVSAVYAVIAHPFHLNVIQSGPESENRFIFCFSVVQL